MLIALTPDDIVVRGSKVPILTLNRGAPVNTRIVSCFYFNRFPAVWRGHRANPGAAGLSGDAAAAGRWLQISVLPTSTRPEMYWAASRSVPAMRWSSGSVARLQSSCRVWPQIRTNANLDYMAVALNKTGGVLASACHQGDAEKYVSGSLLGSRPPPDCRHKQRRRVGSQ